MAGSETHFRCHWCGYEWGQEIKTGQSSGSSEGKSDKWTDHAVCGNCGNHNNSEGK